MSRLLSSLRNLLICGGIIAAVFVLGVGCVLLGIGSERDLP